jgi:hypothetical protein
MRIPSRENGTFDFTDDRGRVWTIDYSYYPGQSPWDVPWDVSPDPPEFDYTMVHKASGKRVNLRRVPKDMAEEIFKATMRHIEIENERRAQP